MIWKFLFGVVLGLVFMASLLLARDALAESGIASVYSSTDADQTGTVVACPGHKLVDSALTAAHRTLPCGTKVRVINKSNGKSVVVTITDRGPYVPGRIIDLTRGAAAAISVNGLAPVEVEKVR